MDRRDFLLLGAGAFVVPFCLRRRPRLVRRRLPVMGTIAEFAVACEDPRLAHRAIDAACGELRCVDRTMSRFRPDSEVGRINRARRGQVGEATATVLAEALRWAASTGGAFDPCLGRAVALWDVANRRRPPDDEEVARFAARRLYRSLELDGGRVLLHEPDVAIDLGGIAKGYGVDRAVRALRRHGVEDGFVNVGGDLYAMGRSEDGDPWRVSIRHTGRTLTLSDRAVATSGDYEQFFEHGGRRYHHLLDPSTGAPARHRRHGVTVVADTCMAADAKATARFAGSDAR